MNEFENNDSRLVVHTGERYENVLTGEVVTEDSEHVVMLKNNVFDEEPPKAVCTCGWEFGPDANALVLALEAHKHSKTTGHQLRKHEGI